MNLDINKHQNVLFQILTDIYTNPKIAPFLGFKGGTAAAMFYGLDRFSVDLDFDLLDKSKEDLVFKEVKKIAQKHGTLKDALIKRFNLFFLVSYEAYLQKVKIEINRRENNSSYQTDNYMGVAMLVMTIEDMFANKLFAMYDRIGRTSRDIYDVWFFLKKRLPINKELVETRSGMKFDQLVKKSIKKLEKLENNEILRGLGQLLTPSQKDQARSKLKIETIGLLKLMIG